MRRPAKPSAKIRVIDPEQFYRDFPGLSPRNHRPASPATDSHNCIALVVGDQMNWWWPKDYPGAKMGARPVLWPLPFTQDENRDSVQEFLKALTTWGFEPCNDGSIETGTEKIALFGKDGKVKHAAVQLRNRGGRWKSKMGHNVDIQHELLAVESDTYGKFLMFLSRPRGNWRRPRLSWLRS